MTRSLSRLVVAEPDELRPVLWAALANFLLLGSYFVIRPLRDEMGVAGGVGNLPWLFLGTLLGMLLLHPFYTALVGRLPRRRFVPLAYAFFIANLIVFWALFRALPEASGIWTGRVFFIWTSVFNLFVVSIFWSLMADLFRPGRAARLFGFVAVGGTLGAAAGSGATAVLASRLPPTDLLLLAAALLGTAVVAAWRLAGAAAALGPGAGEPAAAADDAPVGGRILDGIRAALSSPYLIGIVIYMLLYTVTSTFLYFQQAAIVDAGLADRAARTVFFARVDLAVNLITAFTQVFLTGRIVRRIGIALALAALPLVSLLGFAAIGLAPTLAVIAVVQVLRRSSNYALARPCREMLYTVVPRSAKYKAKNFIDTTVYRIGDQAGAWTSSAVMAVGPGAVLLAAVAAPLTLLWLGVGLWLGRRHNESAGAPDGPPPAAVQS